MLECKILIKLFVLNCVIMCCVRGDAIRAELCFVSAGLAVLKFSVLCLYIVLKFYVIYLSKNTSSKMAKIGGRNM